MHTIIHPPFLLIWCPLIERELAAGRLILARSGHYLPTGSSSANYSGEEDQNDDVDDGVAWYLDLEAEEAVETEDEESFEQSPQMIVESEFDGESLTDLQKSVRFWVEQAKREAKRQGTVNKLEK